MKREDTKFILEEKELPKFWYNVQADMPHPIAPHLHPLTLKTISIADMEPLFAKALIEQEMSTERYIEIPEPVRKIYAQYRPTPLIRARSLEKALDTPCQIYYKYEGASPVGSHKLNSALPQAFYNKAEGIKRLTTETGAGQWGTALSLACSQFSLELLVYMVRSSYEQKPYRRSVIELYGNKVIPSPSDTTAAGRKVLAEMPDTPGTLGNAISEAVEDAMNRADTHYSLGSVLNHVCLHQTVIGQEIKTQLEGLGIQPDILIGACGGGSNFAGTFFPFIRDILSGTKIKVLGVEPIACPSLTRGVFAYDYGDSAGLAPVVKMYTLGHNYTPPGIHAGGLRYHGESPLVSQLYHDGFMEARAVKQNESFAAAVLFARTESIVVAPEASHTLRAVVDEALSAKEAGEAKVIVCTVSGHGLLDLSAYDRYLGGNIQDVDFSAATLHTSLAELPQV